MTERAVGFLPGLLGSRLFLNQREVWGSLRSIRDSIIDPSRLLDSRVEAREILIDLDVATFERFGIAVTFRLGDRWIPLYGPLMDRLEALESYSVYAFPYNWTNSLEGIAANFARWVGDRNNTKPRWTFVAHSFGGLILQRYLSTLDPTETQVERLVFCGAPFQGTARALGAIIDPEDELLRMTPGLIHHFGRLKSKHLAGLRELTSRMDSLYDLLPTGEHGVVQHPEGITVRAQELRGLLEAYVNRRYRELAEADAFAKLESVLPQRSVKPVADLHTNQVSAVFSGDFRVPTGVSISVNGVVEYFGSHPGDGTVPVESACDALPRHSAGGVPHGEIPTHPGVLDWLERVLKRAVETEAKGS